MRPIAGIELLLAIRNNHHDYLSKAMDNIVAATKRNDWERVTTLTEEVEAENESIQKELNKLRD